MKGLSYMNSHCVFFYLPFVGFLGILVLAENAFSFFPSEVLLETNSTRFHKTYILKLISHVTVNIA